MLEEIEVLEDQESNFKKICGIIIMLSSKQIYVTKSCINDPIQWHHMDKKIPLHNII